MNDSNTQVTAIDGHPKNQSTLRMSLANTGRGLTQLNLSDGDMVTLLLWYIYWFGLKTMTVVILTLIMLPMLQDGQVGLHFGWANVENVLAHEVGHSATLAHFSREG